MSHSKLAPKKAQKVFFGSGSVHPALAEVTAERMGLRVGRAVRQQFPDSELFAHPDESIRGRHALLMQSYRQTAWGSVNDAFMEQAQMIDAAVRASAREITIVALPVPYGRQDRKTDSHQPISGALAVDMLASAAGSRIPLRFVTIDMHSGQAQGFFKGPFDHLTAEPIFRKYIKRHINGSDSDKYLIVSPDAGRAKQAEKRAARLGLGVLTIRKDSRDSLNPSHVSRHKQDLSEATGRLCFMGDDVISTAGTIHTAARDLMDAGASGVIAYATHGLFVGPALETLAGSPISKIIVTDTVPTDEAQAALGDRLEIISAAPLLAHALSNIICNRSVSAIFDNQNNM